MLKINHIALSVSDLERSISFYEKILGFKCTDRLGNKTNQPQICILNKDNVTLELFQFNTYEPLPEYRRKLNSDLHTIGTKHVAIEVDNIEETFKKFIDLEVKLITDINSINKKFKYFFIKDPDGIFIEITQQMGA